MWSGIKTLYMGVERYTAAMYGFDDKVFYDEVEAYANNRTSQLKMIKVVGGVLQAEIQDELFRKVKNVDVGSTTGTDQNASTTSIPLDEVDVKHMTIAIEAAKSGVLGTTTEASPPTVPQDLDTTIEAREPFGACIVDTRTGDVIATAGSCRGKSRDSTATAAVNAIRNATKSLKSHNLEGCVLYCTSQPGLMSFTACLWARIDKICYGVTQQTLYGYGYEASNSHLREACEFSKCHGTVTIVANSAQLVPGTTDGNNQEAIEEKSMKMGVVSNVMGLRCEEVFKIWKKSNGTLY